MNMGPPGNWREDDARVRRARARRTRWGTFLVLLILAAAAVLFWRQLDGPSGRGAERPAVSEAGRTPPPASGTPSPAGPSEEATGSDRILSCTAPDGSTFYTNAASCAQADLDNRVTVVESRPAPADAAIGSNCVDSSREGRARHRFLPACQEAFTQALELERYLALAEDPATSVRAEEYCALIAQGVNAGCMATNGQFCFLRICQQRLERGTP